MIEFDDVSFSVPETSAALAAAPRAWQRSPSGRRLVLDRLSFRVEEGRISCLMGVSGMGKTTVLRLMAGLLRPDAGRILINGQDIVGMNEDQLNEVRHEMGFVFQYGALFDSLSVAENIGFGLAQRRVDPAIIERTVRERLHAIGLSGIEAKMPGEISGGMRKRVAMARALATQPKIVLYDEPTSGLDPVMARVIDDLIVQQRDREGTTNFVVSHQLESIMRISDQVLMLHEGKLVAEGTPAMISASDSPVVRQFIEGRAEGPITVG